MNKGNFRLQEFGAIAHGQGRAEESTLPLLFNSAWNCFRLVPPLLDDGFAMSDLCRSWHVTLCPTGLLGPGRGEPAAARTDCWTGEAAVAKGHREGPESPMWKNKHAGIQNKELHKVEDGRHLIESDGNCWAFICGGRFLAPSCSLEYARMLLTHSKRSVRVWRFWRPGCPVNGRQKQAATRRVRRVNSEPSLPTPDPWFEEDDLQTACYRCLGCKILNQGREIKRISSGRILFNVTRHRTWPLGLHFQLYEATADFQSRQSRC